ncbi:MAG TPA: Rrf2 family transcriptional regulator [Thermomicrobiales bacterium]|nr:Rrf2 family transcriptional regulator [Thermomicrobiales bacterium]
MRVSKRLDYGVRALFELAARQSGGPIQSREIAQRQAIPEAYLHQLMAALARAGMVQGTRGPSGGHRLVGDPATITLGQVYLALEGPNRRDHPHDADASSHAMGAAVVHAAWHELEQRSFAYLDSVTLADLVERARSVDEIVDYAI